MLENISMRASKFAKRPFAARSMVLRAPSGGVGYFDSSPRIWAVGNWEAVCRCRRAERPPALSGDGRTDKAFGGDGWAPARSPGPAFPGTLWSGGGPMLERGNFDDLS
jgi:hypothetical protein